MARIALYGNKHDALETARADVLTMAPVLRQIDLFCDFALLRKAFFALDMLLIKNSLFYQALPQIQHITDSADPQKVVGQKIIITNFTLPITQQTDTWLDSLGFF